MEKIENSKLVSTEQLKKIARAAEKFSEAFENNRFASASSFMNGAISDEARECWQNGLYNDDEVKELLLKITHAVADYMEDAKAGKVTHFIVNDWFEQNKTK